MNTLQTAAKFAADTLGADRYMNVYAQSGEWQSLRRRAITPENAYLEALAVASNHINGLITDESGEVAIATVYADGSYANHLDAAAEEEEMHTPDQLEATADLDRMKAYQEKYPEAYQTAYRELLNSPIDKAERTYANGFKRLGAMHTATRPIWQRETPPENLDADQWRTLAAIDRLYEYDWMATLA